MLMPNNSTPRRNPSSDACEIEVKKTRSGTRTRFRGKCTKEMIDYAKAEAEKSPEPTTKRVFED